MKQIADEALQRAGRLEVENQRLSRIVDAVKAAMAESES